jgi:alpha-ribazole phosphatase
MTHLLLVRHGETEWNDQARYQGWEDVPLSSSGGEQAKNLAERLAREPITAIYSSDLRRAHETAQIVAERLGKAVMLEPRLREANLGEWQGLTYTDVRRRYFQDNDPVPAYFVDTPPPGGESLRQLQTRVMDAVESIATQHTDETVLIVTHGGCLKALVCGWLGIALSSYWQLRFDSASISQVSLYPAGAIVSYLNDTAHLWKPGRS